MKGLLRFLSLTAATQLCLLVNQLVLLPLELRIWGRAETSHWFVVLAIANLASVAGLGLRNAGHAELLASVESGDEEATRSFRRIWALTRGLLAGVTTAFLIILPIQASWSGAPFALWVCAAIVSLALDNIIIVRGIWLDTLGHFNRVEALFLGLVTARLALIIPALVFFHAAPAGVAWIMLTTAILGAGAQARVLRTPRLLAFRAGGFGAIRLRSLGIVRLVIAEPASNWMRLSLPVVALAAIGSPAIVTMYVAVRAVFGLARQVINQIARYASVGYVQRVNTNPAAARRIAGRATLMSTALGVGISCAALADNGRLLSIWLHGVDASAERMIVLSFSAGAITYGYQIAAGVLMRSGDVSGVSRRQYVYLVAAAAAALAAWLTGSITIYLILLAAQEVLIALLFISALGPRIARISLLSFAAALALVGVVAGATAFDLGGYFDGVSAGDIAASLGLAAAGASLAVLILVGLDHWSSAQVMGSD